MAWALAFGLGGRAAAGTAIEQLRGRAQNGTDGAAASVQAPVGETGGSGA